MQKIYANINRYDSPTRLETRTKEFNWSVSRSEKLNATIQLKKKLNHSRRSESNIK